MCIQMRHNPLDHHNFLRRLTPAIIASGASITTRFAAPAPADISLAELQPPAIAGNITRLDVVAVATTATTTLASA